ncbi:testis-expressed protein 2 isoform X1 [Penaeus vannamei]|uniref:testis-expressed protein 2 isoform X1 n=2 Tax=Penaeus vannamei TaxID=6689 RepID=UPI000F67E368|nr:testis-expressed protein 2-like [Penaeus vannamei]
MGSTFWNELKAAKMSGRDGSPKISLALLKGRSAAKSVPSITFRFNPSGDNITQVSDAEEEEDEVSSEVSSAPSLDTSSVGSVTRAESLRDASPVKEPLGSSLGKRSSSLDSNSGPLVEPSTSTAKPVESGGLLSRLTKTFEDKINEIRSEKKEKESKGERDKDKEKLSIGGDGSTESEGGSVSGDRSPTSKERKPIDIVQKTVEEDKASKTDFSGSPPKTKTSIVQDITEHTSKIKSELGNIRPKLSELRQRRSSKESGKNSKENSKGRPFVFTSLLGRDEGLGEEMLLECDEAEVDRAVEAHEDPCVFDEDLAGMDGEDVSSEKDIVDSSKSKTTTPQSSPKKRKSPPSPKKATELPLKEQCLQIVNSFPVSVSVLSKIALGLFIVCFVLPLPRFLAGLVLGVVLAGVAFYCLLRLVLPVTPEPPLVDDGPVLLTLPTYEDKQLYKGWMNELEGEYSPDSYHVSLTHSVFVRLQGSKLQIDHPRGKVPKHARQKEEIRNTVFTHHREYDIAGCEVFLSPRNLPRRWLWSRKYPICIRLHGGSKGSTPSPVSITSTPTGSAHGSPIRFSSAILGRQGSSESGEGNWSLDNNKSSGEDDLMTSSLDMASFEEVTQDMCQEKSLYLFARCDREKDDWFRRLVAASELYVKAQSSPSHKPPPQDIGDTISLEGIPESPFEPAKDQLQMDSAASTPPDLSFERYMARLLYQPGGMTSDGTPGPANVAWINALVGRLLYDFLRNPYWANKVQERVQRKLSKLHIPYFVGEIVVCGVNMGSATPQLNAVGSPQVDARGLWVDLNVEYSGNFTMSLETKLDLMKLKRSTGIGTNMPNTSSPPSPAEPVPHAGPRVYTRSQSSERLLRNVHFDTDTDDSVESSSEEEYEEEGLAAEAGLPVGGSGPTSRRLLKLVDSVAGSRYFQQAAEWRLLQRALQGVSNTRIELSVEVRRLAGTLALNIPPPPADRLWYGFRGVPELVMVARPRLGDRMLNLPFLVEFIQKQLRIVFEKVFVLPNMDDLVIPIMSPLLPGQHQQPRPPWESSHILLNTTEISAPSIPTSSVSTSGIVTPTVKFTPSPH